LSPNNKYDSFCFACFLENNYQNLSKSDLFRIDSFLMQLVQIINAADSNHIIDADSA
jgi:hypothetical protein